MPVPLRLEPDLLRAYPNDGEIGPVDHTRGRDLDLQLWTMLSFELWCRRFLDTTDVRDVAPERTRQTRVLLSGSVLPTIEPNLNIN